MSLNSTVDAVTDRIRERSRAGREAYLDRCRAAPARKPRRGTLSCGNLAHGFAACGPSEKSELAGTTTANIAIVSSYNDMLSAHQPYETFPPLIKQAVREVGGPAPFARGAAAGWGGG